MNIYQLDVNGYWTGTVATVDESQGAPIGWVISEPPVLSLGEFALWTGRWSVTTTSPPIDWAPLIAARRFKAEESGTVWNGYGIATDRSSQNKITQEDIAVTRGLRIDGSGWKCLDLSTGMVVFRPTSNAEINQISTAVYLHVSSSFKREEALLAAVADGSITAAMVEQGWPS